MQLVLTASMKMQNKLRRMKVTEDKFYCSDRIKDLVDLSQFEDLKDSSASSDQLFGDFVSYSKSKSTIAIQVDKRVIKSLLLNQMKNIFYSYMGVKFFLDTENLEITKFDEKFLVHLSILKMQEIDSYE
jgi:hypothetical protein